MPKIESHGGINTDYLREAFADLPGLIDRVVRELFPHKDKFDGIVFRGLSGSLVAPMVASRLGVPFAVVRKSGEGAHSGHKVEGWYGFKRYIIIDDLIATGGTVKIIQQEMLKMDGAPECVGFCLWFSGVSIIWRGNPKNFTHYESKFLYPDNTPRPTVAEQILAAYNARPQNAVVADCLGRSPRALLT